MPAWPAMRVAGRRRGGFTLVEAVCAMVLIATIGGIASGAVFSGARAYADWAARGRLQADLSITLDRIVRELRMIADDAGVAGVQPSISAVGASSIAWNGNWSLSLTGGEIRIVEAGSAARTLLTGVTGFEVRALDASGAAMAATLSGTACHAIRRLEITISAGRDGVSDSVRTRLFLRCAVTGS